MPKKVVVAMSGGVDSSVAAALLKKQGFPVLGVFMRFWLGRVGYNRCCSLEAEQRAREVSRILGIPFYVFNFEKEFKKKVVDYFLEEHKLGFTPNPCTVCNKEIKFGLLLEKALVLGANYLATGHYVRLKNSRLFVAKDKNKDQSYFLWKLNQKQLKRVLFPIGNHAKAETRALARKFKLPVAETPESQEICFVPDTINKFLKRYFKEKRGPIVEQVHYGVKKIVGQHKGLIFYTIGQRKGIGLPGGPYWVVSKDFKKNILIVTKNEKDLLEKEVSFKNANWLSGRPPRLPAKLKAKIRSRHQAAWGVLKKNNKFVFKKAQRAVTPGQSIVFYHGQELLGGGIIS